MAASSPQPVSRRAVLRGALRATALVAAVPGLPLLTAGCASIDLTADADALRDLGATLRDGPEGPRLAASGLPGIEHPITDESALFSALDRLGDQVRADFTEGRTVLGRGWVLADTEAVALVAYARA